MKKILLVLILLFALTGCAQGARQEPASTSKRRSTLQLKLRPKNAKVKVVRQVSKDGIIKVGIHVSDYGSTKFPASKKTLHSSQVGVSLTRQGYVAQVLEIYSPAKDTTATLIPFSTAANRIEASFRQAARAYNLRTAYPTYLPLGYRLTKAEYQDIIQGASSPALNHTTRFLLLEWSKGKSVIMMQLFSAEGLVSMGRPPDYGETIRINKNVKARFVRRTNLVNFFLNDKLVWYLSADDGMPRSIIIKMVKSMKLSES